MCHVRETKTKTYMTRVVEFAPIGNYRIFDGASYMQEKIIPAAPFTCGTHTHR